MTSGDCGAQAYLLGVLRREAEQDDSGTHAPVVWTVALPYFGLESTAPHLDCPLQPSVN